MTDRTRTAPFYQIPSNQIVSVEHPAIIQNADKAVDTLQGNSGISKILNPPKADTPANLVLRPEDAMARPLQSTSSPSNNILLKVTVPKRTGRKRRKGTDEPFTGPDSTSGDAAPGSAPSRRTAEDLRRSLEDNVGRYQVETVGMVGRTHVFRGIPDFVLSTTASPFTNRFRDQILSFDCKKSWTLEKRAILKQADEKMKQFDINMDKGAISNVDVIPPPSFSHWDTQFNYLYVCPSPLPETPIYHVQFTNNTRYRQNPTVKQAIDKSGQVTTVNTSQATKVLTHLVPFDIPTVPQHPRDSCPPIETLDPTLQETIAVVTSLFTTRPAWTRRGLRNSLTTHEQRLALRHAIPYVGYIFRSGPWRDAIVKLGHDPRSSPDYRIYQTAMFRILPRDPEVARDGGRRHAVPRGPEVAAIDPLAAASSTTTTTAPDGSVSTTTPVSTSTSHIFTGQPPLPRDGRMWMFCDITDPCLRSLLFPTTNSTSDEPPAGFLRETCETITDGWYGSGTLAKTKTIMRAKIHALATQNAPTDDAAEFGRIIESFPDHVDDANSAAGVAAFSLDPEVASSREIQLASDIRAAVKAAVSWRGMVRSAGGGGGGGAGGRKGGKAGDGVGKAVRWGNENEGSEGEEEEMDQNEAEAEAEADAMAEGDEDQEGMDIDMDGPSQG